MRSLSVSCLGLGLGLLTLATPALAKRPDHPVDLAKFAKDYAAFKPALKQAKECVEFFRADKDGGATMEEEPADAKKPQYTTCATAMRAAVTQYIKAGGAGAMDADSIKANLTTPVGMMLWLSWTLADARLGSEDQALTSDAHFRWVLANDGTEAEPTIPANIANEMLAQVKAAATAGKDEVKGFADDEVFQGLTLIDSAGTSWLSDVQAALNDNFSTGHLFLFDDVANANKMFARDHYSVWVNNVYPYTGKVAKTDQVSSIIEFKRIDDMESVCTKSVNTGYVNLEVRGDKLQASAVKSCAQTGKVKASWWPGTYLMTKANAAFVASQMTGGKRVALNCGHSDSTVRSSGPIAPKQFADGLVIKAGAPTVYMATLPNKWVATPRNDESELRYCNPAQVYVGPGAPEANNNPPWPKLGKLVMYFGIDLSK